MIGPAMVGFPAMVLVAGPPCAGKTAYALEHAEPRDLVVDTDTLYTTLGPSNEPFANPEHHRPLVWAAFYAILAEQRKQRAGSFTVWAVQCAPRAQTRSDYRRMNNARVVMLRTPIEDCLARARESRPASWLGFIEQWFREYEPHPRDEIVRLAGVLV